MHIANHMAGSHSQAPLSKLMTHEFQHTVEKSYLERKQAHQHKILYFCFTGGSIISTCTKISNPFQPARLTLATLTVTAI